MCIYFRMCYVSQQVFAAKNISREKELMGAIQAYQDCQLFIQQWFKLKEYFVQDWIWIMKYFLS